MENLFVSMIDHSAESRADTLPLTYSMDDLSSGRSQDDNIKTQRAKERNREHAKKTRLRKKAQLDTLKNKLLDLQNESRMLRRALEEKNTANILLCLGSAFDPKSVESDVMDDKDFIMEGDIFEKLKETVRLETIRYEIVDGVKRARRSDDLETNAIGTSDEEDLHDSRTGESSDDHNQDKSFQEIQEMRKERNRIHAKLTRDRKKLFTSKVHNMIAALESRNSSLRAKLRSL